MHQLLWLASRCHKAHDRAEKGCRELETSPAAALLGQRTTAPGWAKIGSPAMGRVQGAPWGRLGTVISAISALTTSEKKNENYSQLVNSFSMTHWKTVSQITLKKKKKFSFFYEWYLHLFWEMEAWEKQTDPNSAPSLAHNLQGVGYLPPVLPSYSGGQWNRPQL